MLNFLTNWAYETWGMVVEAAPWLLVGFVLAGVIYAWLPLDKVRRHLGGPGWGGVLKASLVGIPLPLCSCSVIPVAASLRKQGASKGAFLSFLISTPETGVDSIAISYALLGPFLAVVRPVAAFVTALTAGFMIGWTGDEARESARAEGRGSLDCSNTGCCEGTGETGSGRLITALRYGFVDLFADLAIWLVAGFVLAGLLSAVMPEGFLERRVGSGIMPMLLMLVVGMPLYVCATSSTPVAAALIAAGLSPGAALVFLLVGPASNAATMVVVARDLGKRGLVLYLTTMAVVALMFGLIVDQVVPSLPLQVTALPESHARGGSPAASLAAVVLIVLVVNGLRIRYRPATYQ
ncbi:MAG: SO_0444 family Cu/Zn efflux transporter [Planctomycetota bacterium]|jgi:uncharacterized membrane protein YraQ (UPF0718 family)